ncbi:MAG TPA: class I SAM-dependent methyltransferase [Chloroflexota bacterium]|nr:class I SAM-dependent methyltransferase [Chloroflexota bacterium]
MSPVGGTPPTDPSVHSLVQEQIDYYEARADEYDRQLELAGSYADTAANEDPQGQDILEAQSALEHLAPRGDVLELACGTGWWTRNLARTATSVTAVDASQAMLDINRRRVTSGNVRYVAANLFTWVPDRSYDFIFFAFWLSHVPASQFEPFWRTVDAALAPGGLVFFVDEHAASTTREQEDWAGGQDVVARRSLADGRSYRIAKIYLEPDDLRRRLEALGWDFTFRSTLRQVFHAIGERTR